LRNIGELTVILHAFEQLIGNISRVLNSNFEEKARNGLRLSH
jgi:hypothetical protein